MRPLLAELGRRGIAILNGESDDRLLLKGVAWQLDRRDDRMTLQLHAPIARTECPRHWKRTGH